MSLSDKLPSYKKWTIFSISLHHIEKNGSKFFIRKFKNVSAPTRNTENSLSYDKKHLSVTWYSSSKRERNTAWSTVICSCKTASGRMNDLIASIDDCSPVIQTDIVVNFQELEFPEIPIVIYSLWTFTDTLKEKYFEHSNIL